MKRHIWMFSATERINGQDWILPGYDRVVHHRVAAELLWIWLWLFTPRRYSVLRIQPFDGSWNR